MPSATIRTSHPFQTDDRRLRVIHDKVVANLQIDHEDTVALYDSKDILALGWLANHARERMHGATTRYRVDELAISQAAQSAGCPHCGRVRAETDVLAQVEQVGSDAAEFVLLGGDLDRLWRAIEILKKHWPTVRVTALTVEEIAAQEEGAGKIIANLREAGADGLIGSGAEVFLPAMRHRLWHHTGTVEQRADVRRAASEAGLTVPHYVVQRNATGAQQAAELLGFRDAAPQTFSALSFDADASTNLNMAVTTGMQEMKQIAVERLVLGNVAEIRAYAQMLGSKLVQIALRFGASELDGTVLDSEESLDARKREFAREITVAGTEPQEVPTARRVVLVA